MNRLLLSFAAVSLLLIPSLSRGEGSESNENNAGADCYRCTGGKVNLNQYDHAQVQDETNPPQNGDAGPAKIGTQ